MEKYSWSFNENAEIWYEAADTIAECISQASVSEERGDNNVVYIGENVAYSVSVDAETVLEQVAEEAYDFCELAEDWDAYDRKKPNELEELSEQLTSVVKSWLKKYNRDPCFWRVKNIIRYNLEDWPKLKEATHA